MNNVLKALLMGFVTLALETIPQVPVMEAMCSGTFTRESVYAIPGIIVLKLVLFLPFYWLSRLVRGIGPLVHAGTYLVVSTVVAPLFAWNIFFCTWHQVVTGTLLAGLAQALSSRLMPRQLLVK